MMNKHLQRLLGNIRGVAAVEFALAMPLLIILSIGGFELTRYMLINEKLSKTVSSMADLAARAPKLTEADITNMFYAIEPLMEPYALGPDGVVILSDVSNNGTDTRVNWQRRGGGTATATSHIGASGAVATFPTGFTLTTNEDVIIAEISYVYRPLVAPDIIRLQTVRKVKFSKPRLGALTVINP